MLLKIYATRIQRTTGRLSLMLLQVLGLALRLHSLFDALSLLFVEKYIVLHLLQVNLIIKIDDVLGVACLLVDHTLCVYLSDILFILKAVGVLVDDSIEGNLLLI